jgi:hypothetical protein
MCTAVVEVNPYVLQAENGGKRKFRRKMEVKTKAE